MADSRAGKAKIRCSGPTGRACGSIYTTASVHQLTKMDATNKSLGDDDKMRDHTKKGSCRFEDPHNQKGTYAEFTRTVHEHLLKDVDRRGYEHGLTFSAQDDAWQMC